MNLLMTSSNAQELLHAWNAANGGKCNSGQRRLYASVALTRLPKVVGATSRGENQAQSQECCEAYNSLLSGLLDVFQRTGDNMRPRSLANAMWALARLRDARSAEAMSHLLKALLAPGQEAPGTAAEASRGLTSPEPNTRSDQWAPQQQRASMIRSDGCRSATMRLELCTAQVRFEVGL